MRYVPVLPMNKIWNATMVGSSNYTGVLKYLKLGFANERSSSAE